jgi:tetratricopeptide (TPR) repeat protein
VKALAPPLTTRSKARRQSLPGGLDRLRAVTEVASTQAISYADWCEIWNDIGDISEQIKENIDFLPIWLRVLRGARQQQTMLELTKNYENQVLGPSLPVFQIERAWALLTTNPSQMLPSFHSKFGEAASLLETAIPHLQGEQLGWAYRCLGSAYYETGEDWEYCFNQAILLLSGYALGITVYEYGRCLSFQQRNSEVIRCWTKALVLLDGDAYYSAWVRHALGSHFLRLLDLKNAKNHFEKMEKLCNQPGGASFKARSLCGMASVARLQRHLKAAKDLYQQALGAEGDNDDHQQALWGLGQTYRLQDDLIQAHEYLQKAQTIIPESQWVYPTLAAVALQQDAMAEAEADLRRLVLPTGNTSLRATIVQAELLRKRGNDDFYRLMQGFPQNSSVFHEEKYLFPELFVALGYQVPTVSQETVVSIISRQGYANIMVNSEYWCTINAGKPLDLLLFLLQRPGYSATLEQITADLWGEDVPSDQRVEKGGRLHPHVCRLRKFLGWRGSLDTKQKRRLVHLDETVTWQWEANASFTVKSTI